MTGTPESTGRPQRAAADQPDTPLHLRKEIRSADHNEGLELVSGTVARWTEVSAHLCRVTIAAPTVARDPVWATPNVAVRLRIGRGPEQVSRIYTVRSCSTAAATIDVDVVRHGHPSPMMTVARRPRRRSADRIRRSAAPYADP
ncbi:siderophore-interacting protein [Gordonia iterans]